MKTKQTIKRVMVVGLTAGALFTSIILSANEISKTEETTYLSVPMHVFDKLTGNDKEKGIEYYTYNDGKLEKCTTNLDEKIKEQCLKNDENKGKDGRNNRSDKKRGMRKHKDNKFVLLTVEQMENLKKQKLEQKLKDSEDQKGKMAEKIQEASANAITANVDGKEVKVVSMHKGFKQTHKAERFVENTDQN